MFKNEKILTPMPVKEKDAINLVLAFPNTYYIGMASLGFQTAWKYFNQASSVRVTRWFTDIKEDCKWLANSLPEYIGFSFSWELDYKNIFYLLEKNNVPLKAKDRKENDPLVFAGGQVPNSNPEPFVDNFDFFLIGDIETLVNDFIQTIIKTRSLSREEKLNELSKLPGLHVPHKDSVNQIPAKRQFSGGNLSFSSILTPNSVWPNIFLLEVVRGCPELCRFCLASYGSLPFRAPSVSKALIPAVEIGLKYTNKIGLLGASVTQHPEFETLIDYLLKKSSVLNVQIASVRADTISKFLAEGLFKLGARSITMAVETGSERLRNIINKKVSNETIKSSIQTIYNAGFKSIKLYGMVGLPFETQDDLNETIKFLKNLKSGTGTLKLTWGCSVFVPKAGTPFQWYGVDKNAKEKLDFLSKELHKIGVQFRPESYKWSQIQALISRGNRSINPLLEKAYRYSSTLGSFNKAIKEEKVDVDYFIHKTWEIKTKLPWDSIQGHLSKETVMSHSKNLIS